MKIYHTDGRTHEGEPVDCAEIRAMDPRWNAPDPAVKAAADAAAAAAAAAKHDPKAVPTQAQLDSALKKLPAAVKAGEYKDADVVVTQMLAYFGPELFTAETEAAVRGVFAKGSK